MTPCLRINPASAACAPRRSFFGWNGQTVAVSRSLPVPSTTATLTPLRMPGSRPMVVLPPAGAASSRSFRLRAKTRIAFCICVCRRPSRAASSGRVSARMSRAPSSTALVSGTAPVRKAAERAAGTAMRSARIASAKGASPFSRAIIARVRRLTLEGREMSSSSAFVTAQARAVSSSAVSLRGSRIDPRIAMRRWSMSRRQTRRPDRVRSCLSSGSPVASLRQRATKGTVAPPSSKSTAAAT